MAELKETIGWCAKCWEKKPMKDITEMVSKRGMLTAQGKCTVCGTKMARILGKAKPTEPTV